MAACPPATILVMGTAKALVDEEAAEPASVMRMAVSALVAGTGLGLFSVLGERLPVDTPLEAVVGLANAAGPWLCAAFAVGAINGSVKRGVIAATAGLAIAIGLYYVPIYATGNGFAGLERLAGLWLVAALVVGPAFGAGGALWADRGSRWRAAAAGALAGALLAEAAFRLVQVEVWTGFDLARTSIQVGIIETIAGLLVPILLLGRGERGTGYVASLLVAIVGFGCLWGVTALVMTLIVG
jgi:hypothetical protein